MLPDSKSTRPTVELRTALHTHRSRRDVTRGESAVNRATIIAFALAALASHATTASAQSSANTPPAGYVAATRSGPECADVKARTVSWTLSDTVGLQIPWARRLQMPPLPRGRNAEGKLGVTMRVDETGQPMKDSVFVKGRTDLSYLRDFVQAMRKNLYWPAVLDGCAVTARVWMEVDLGPAAGSAASPAAPASNTLPRGYLAATRSGPECAAAMAKTASLALGTMDGLQRPVARTLHMPPMTRGRKVQGRLLAMLRIDETGRPMRDSVFVTGTAEPKYIREYVEALRKDVYWPAVLDGCNVTARVSTEVDLGLRP